MKKFDIPDNYRSKIISRIKEFRKINDPRKKDFSPLNLDFGSVEFIIPRHFGFCYGVENAIEIAYKTISDNPDKKIFLLSEMIHNPGVNNDLISMGVKFIFDTSGNQLLDWSEISKEDIVLVPAFGTTVEIENILNQIGIEITKYDTTCPFVEKVWKRAASLGKDDYTVIIHGKATHEETRATFSHSKGSAPSLIVYNLAETEFLNKVILGEVSNEEFYKFFEGKLSEGFDPDIHLNKLGVVNQTTMLASETQAIAESIKSTLTIKYGIENIKDHYSDTRDTLCYATNDNQNATLALLEENLDLAIVVGGFNSSNTTHIVELLETKFPTYFINDSANMISENEIQSFNIHNKTLENKDSFIPQKEKVKIAITSGASCPDSVVDEVLLKLLSFFPAEIGLSERVDVLIGNES